MCHPAVLCPGVCQRDGTNCCRRRQQLKVHVPYGRRRYVVQCTCISCITRMCLYVVVLLARSGACISHKALRFPRQLCLCQLPFRWFLSPHLELYWPSPLCRHGYQSRLRLHHHPTSIRFCITFSIFGSPFSDAPIILCVSIPSATQQ